MHLLNLSPSQRKRLLHPAAETKVILSQYVATIRCLRIVDPPGVLLYKVADPIRRYLRYVFLSSFPMFLPSPSYLPARSCLAILSHFPSPFSASSHRPTHRDRPDTIRAIVANLVGDDDDGGEALLDDAEPVQPLQTAEVEDYTEPNWEPEPIDAGRGGCLLVL